jgi:hypothetical protein
MEVITAKVHGAVSMQGCPPVQCPCVVIRDRSREQERERNRGVHLSSIYGKKVVHLSRKR